jgi:hypothetical protein
MTTYSADIKPLFRPNDLACMVPHGIRLDDQTWMCDPAASPDFLDHGHARLVFQRLQAGTMPPDGAWPPAQIATYRNWMSGGFQP